MEYQDGLPRVPAAAVKRWRIYFNRKDDFPIIWCVDEGDISSQIRLGRISLERVDAFACTDLIAPNKHRQRLPFEAMPRHPNEPAAWIEVQAKAIFELGGVTFYGK